MSNSQQADGVEPKDSSYIPKVLIRSSEARQLLMRERLNFCTLVENMEPELIEKLNSIILEAISRGKANTFICFEDLPKEGIVQFDSDMSMKYSDLVTNYLLMNEYDVTVYGSSIGISW